jgi:hypothetical protein
MAAATKKNEQKRRRNRGDVNAQFEVIELFLYRPAWTRQEKFGPAGKTRFSGASHNAAKTPRVLAGLHQAGQF